MERTTYTLDGKEFELRHYGVLGMKWGIRRARRKGAAQAYKDRLAKAKTHKEKRAAKEEYERAKNDKSHDVAIANRLYSKQSKAVNRRVANMDMGKALVQSYLMGSYGALKYNEARANRYASRGQAAVEGLMFNIGNTMVYGGLSAAKYLDNRFARKTG